MHISNFCLKKRQQEQKQLQKLLLASFVGSALLHGVLIIFLPGLMPQKSPEKVEKPIELILVDKPEPPKPEPIETKVTPKPEPPKPKPEPTPPPPPQAKTPEPPKPKPEPKPAPPPKVEQPQQVLTTPDTTATNSVPIPPPQAETSATTETSESSQPAPPTSEKTVATNSAPAPAPATNPTTDGGGISCVDNCQPEYPSALNGDEGSAGVKLTISPNGSVTDAQLVQAHSNMMLNRQALLAARKMKFSKIDNAGGASVVVKINFTVEGSEFDRLAKERQRQLEQEAARQQEAERQRQEAARQQEAAIRQQQEAERQRQAELERKRQAEIQQQQAPTPIVSPEPVNSTSQTEQEREDEMLRKFRERIENHQGN